MIIFTYTRAEVQAKIHPKDESSSHTPAVHRVGFLDNLTKPSWTPEVATSRVQGWSGRISTSTPIVSLILGYGLECVQVRTPASEQRPTTLKSDAWETDRKSFFCEADSKESRAEKGLDMKRVGA